MGRYTIYFSTISELKEYEKYLAEKKAAKKQGKDFNKIEPTKPSVLSHREDKKPTTLDKYQVDLTTSYYKNEGELLTELKKYPDRLELKDLEKNKLMAIYRSNGEIKKLPLIYNSRVLYLATRDIYEKRKKNIPFEYINISQIEELENYIEQVKEYMRVPDYAKSLERLFGHDNSFAPAIRNYCKYINEVETSIGATEEINKCVSIIDFKMHKYDNLRKIILWERKHIREKQVNNENRQQQEFDLSDFSLEQKGLEEEINTELRNSILDVARRGGKDLLLKEFTKQDLSIMPDSFLKTYKIDIDKLKRKESSDNAKILKEYEGDIIYTYYDEGGSSYVVEQMDISDLIRYPKVVLDSVGVNIDGLVLNNGDVSNNGKYR